MVSPANPTATSRLRAEKQSYDSNENAWGTHVNVGALDVIDEAFGVVAITVDSDVTLDSQNYTSDEARRMVLILSGAGGFTVTAPAVDKPYLVVNNCTGAVTMTPQGGTGVSVRAGVAVWYYTNEDGDTGFVVDTTLDKINAPTASVDLNSQKITSLATPTADTDAASKGYVDTFTADRDADGNKVVNLADPTSAQDAATKNYIDTLAASSDLGTVAAIADDIETLADIEDGTVATDAISDVAAIASDVTTVASNSANVTIVAGNDANVTAVGSNITNVNAVAAIDDDVSVVADNISDVTNFADVYIGPSATAPTTRADGSALQGGDLYFNTSSDSLNYYDGSGWAPIEAVTLSSQAQAEAGTDNTTVMTPLRVAEAIAAQVETPTAYGAIGTYVIASSTAWNTSTEYLPDTTVAGSSLTRSNASSSLQSPINSSASNEIVGGTTSLGLSGTWRLMTRVYRATGNYPVGLFVRVS